VQNIVTGNPASWNYGFFNNSKLETGTSYYIVSMAIDDVGNLEASGLGNQGTVRSSTFTYDINVPTSVVQNPAHFTYKKAGTMSLISGTAQDWVNVSGAVNSVKQIDLFIQQATSTLFYNGSNWTNGVTAITVSTQSLIFGNTWGYNLTESALNHNTTYFIWTRVMDLAGNLQTSFSLGVSSNSFNYDVGQPTSAITSIANGNFYRKENIPNIAGTAIDETEGGRVFVSSYSIEDTDMAVWWNGSSFTAVGEQFFGMSYGGGQSWSGVMMSTNLVDGRTYG